MEILIYSPTFCQNYTFIPPSIHSFFLLFFLPFLLFIIGSSLLPFLPFIFLLCLPSLPSLSSFLSSPSLLPYIYSFFLPTFLLSFLFSSISPFLFILPPFLPSSPFSFPASFLLPRTIKQQGQWCLRQKLTKQALTWPTRYLWRTCKLWKFQTKDIHKNLKQQKLQRYLCICCNSQRLASKLNNNLNLSKYFSNYKNIWALVSDFQKGYILWQIKPQPRPKAPGNFQLYLQWGTST